MERFYLLAPALLLLAGILVAFVVYCGLCASGRAPKLSAVKHNQLFGPFFARFLVWLISPVERALKGRVAPNLITAASLLSCALAGVAAAGGYLADAVWLYVFAGILDVLDGRLARSGGKPTAAGALFDSVSDRWGELFVFAGFAWDLHTSPWLLAVIGALAGSMMVSYTRARAEGLGIEVSGGLMQRAERIVLVAAGTLVAAWFGAEPSGVALVVPILGITMTLCGLASMATAVNRWIVAYRALVRRDAPAQPVVVVSEPERAPAPAAPAPVRPAIALAKTDLRKVRPVQQH